ncbi:MAG: 16S rRNA (uracil(1498)-N(3))-methyltransferase [Marinilabiliaceae bacterium]|nr:16S rRNA (uracil(1498)-N(3))-methyltransferase [Marinilabiliaceae bacterium]
MKTSPPSFYEPDIDNNGGYLNQDESHHCINVLRLKKNDSIYIINGNGSKFECKIIDYQQNRCKIDIIKEEVSTQEISKCCIAVAPTKNIDRFEWFLEKSCEIGISEITPIICKKSERKVVNHQRLEKIITSSTKQCESLWRPKLNKLISFDQFISLTNNTIVQKLIAYCFEDNNKKLLKNIYEKNRNVLILIGPEGDFDQTEINLAKNNGFNSISLGNNRLRTETAALAACLTIQILNS